jgi:ABC-type multidrug transport system permease subunit
MLKSNLRVLTNSFILQSKEKAVEDFFITTLIFQPVVFTLLTVGLYLYGGKPDFGLFAIIGTGMISIWNNNLWSSGNIVNNERRGGTLPLVMASPTELTVILVGKSLANALTSIVAMGVTFLTGVLFFDLPLGIKDPAGFLIGLILTIVALTCMGLVLGTVFVITRHGIVMNVANYPIYLLSGLTVPLTLLPYWVQPFSDILAPRWGNVALNQAAGVMGGHLAGSYLWLIGLSILYLIIARFLYNRVEHMARRAGTLEMW